MTDNCAANVILINMGSDAYHHHKKTACPNCGYSIDAHAATDGVNDKPKKDDISICAKCATWNKYTEDLEIVTLTEEDKENIAPELLLEMQGISERIKLMNRNMN